MPERQQQKAGPACGCIHATQKRLNLAYAVEHVRGNRHITGTSTGGWPGIRDDAHIRQLLVDQALLELRTHGWRWLDRQQLSDISSQQRLVAAGASADIDQPIAWAQTRQQEAQEAIRLWRALS